MTTPPDDLPDRDVLISRIVDGRATPSDWGALEHVSLTDATVWRDLAMSQKQHVLLSAAADPLLARAERVNVPDPSAPIRLTPEHHQTHLHARGRRFMTWGGWAAAAALGLAYLNGFVPRAPELGGNQASLAPTFHTPEQALAAYYEQGQKLGTVVGEVPQKVLLQSSPLQDGAGYDVVYVRQIVERARVPSLYSIGSDELGNPAPVPFTPPARSVTIDSRSGRVRSPQGL